MDRAETIKMMDAAIEKGYKVEVVINGEYYEYKDTYCCICGKKIEGWGNNPWPVNIEPDARCCDDCNSSVVLEARINSMRP